MIHVQNLTKYYGDYPAVRDVSFTIPKGQIVGFLGPNGAGKSTTMLILDGPTSGLDPAQIRETRNLIRELGKEHTLILSTHILPEVEMTCHRVIIIHQGRLAASGMVDDLEGQAGAQPVLDVTADGNV